MTISDGKIEELAREGVREAIADLAHDRLGQSERLQDLWEEETPEEVQEADMDRLEAAFKRWLASVEDPNVYTKTVTAIQWRGDNADELTELMGANNFDPHGAGENDDDPEATASMRDGHRGGSWRPLITGSWVLRDDAGDWHMVCGEEFAATYRKGGM